MLQVSSLKLILGVTKDVQMTYITFQKANFCGGKFMYMSVHKRP